MSLTMSSEIDYVFTNIDQRVFKFPKRLHYFCSKRRWGLGHFSNTTVSAMFFVSFGATVAVHLVVSTGKPS